MAGTTTTGKVKWDEEKFESSKTMVGKSQRNIGRFMGGSMKGQEGLMDEETSPPRKKKK